MYSIILNRLRQIEEKIPEANRGQFRMFMNLKYYPSVLLIAFFFPAFRRIYQMFDDEAPFWLGVCQTLSAGLYGGLNAFVYGMFVYCICYVRMSYVVCANLPKE